jgi:hypothetical protein
MAENKETLRVQLSYPIERVKEPVLYHLVVDYGLVPNIRRANMDIATGGYIFLELTGEKESLDDGVRFLERCGITVTPAGLDGTEEWGV